LRVSAGYWDVFTGPFLDLDRDDRFGLVSLRCPARCDAHRAVSKFFARERQKG
jgi:hypothetical protein